MSTAASLHRALNRPLARYWLTERFDPVYADGPNLQWLRMNAQAWRRFRHVQAPDFTHVGMFSFSRAGSHLFESQFHYIPSCFCFGEARLDFRSDLNWRTFLCRGMYRTDSIQDKQAASLTHLFYNCNKRPDYLDDPQWSAEDLAGYRRKWVLVARNPLRVLLSRAATGKKKWVLTPEAADELFDWYRKASRKFLDLLDRRPSDTEVVSVEQFVTDPERNLSALAQSLGIAQGDVASRPKAKTFFRHISRTGEVPVVREGKLVSPTRPITIEGWGGEFNPLLEIDPSRLYRHVLADELPNDILAVARTRLGETAFDFYLNDHQHRFVGVKAADLLTDFAK